MYYILYKRCNEIKFNKLEKNKAKKSVMALSHSSMLIHSCKIEDRNTVIHIGSIAQFIYLLIYSNIYIFATIHN